VHYLLAIHDFDLIFSFLKGIMIALDKWVFFSIISMNFILFIFLYLGNTGKTTIIISYKVTIVCKHPRCKFKWNFIMRTWGARSYPKLMFNKLKVTWRKLFHSHIVKDLTPKKNKCQNNSHWLAPTLKLIFCWIWN
jgi:hypothetical protein